MAIFFFSFLRSRSIRLIDYAEIASALGLVVSQVYRANEFDQLVYIFPDVRSNRIRKIRSIF